MEKILLFAFLGSGAATMILAAGWAIILKRFLDYLERYHPSTFDQLGRPRFGGNISAHRTPQLLSFLIRRRDRQLNDVYLSHLSRILFWWWWAFLSVFVFMIIMMVWVQKNLIHR
jgi:hypothetical protein